MSPTDETPGAVLGRVAEVRCYPVKSMSGGTVPGARLDALGVPGDRAFAVLDVATGAIASAKHPRKWAALLQCTAAYVSEPGPGEPLPTVVIELPSGERIESADPDADARLSRFLGAEVKLVHGGGPELTREADRAPPGYGADGDFVRVEVMGSGAPTGRYFDYAPVHVLTTATLRAFRRRDGSVTFDRRRFRPNVVVEVDGEGFVENDWLGRVIRMADTVLEVFDPCPRCVVTTLAQPGLERQPLVLRAVAESNGASGVTQAPGVWLEAVAGIYARPVEPGIVTPGDEVVAHGTI